MSKKSEKKAKRTSNGRPVQPRCECDKALYKRMDAGPVKTSDPYGWCRNPDCDHYNKDQSGESRFKPLAAGDAKPKSAAKAAVDAALGNGKKPKAEKAAKPAKESKLKLADQPAKAEKPIVVADSDEEKARKRISKILKRGGDDVSVKASLGMVLAILNEQTGSKDAGNALVAEFKLDELYGINKPVADKKRSKKRSKKPAAEAAASAS